MAERKPPVVSKDTPIGPDVDLDREDVRLPGGVRLTKTMAARIVDEVHQAIGGRGGREPDLVPLRELAAELARLLARELKELRLWERAVKFARRVAAGSHSKVG